MNTFAKDTAAYYLRSPFRFGHSDIPKFVEDW